MNQKQREYALSRITQIKGAKVSALQAATTLPGKWLSIAEKMELIQRGLVPFVENAENHYRFDQVLASFDFANYEVSETRDEVKYAEGLKALNDEAERVKDEVMLGDEEAAKALIREFAKAHA